MLPRSLLAGLLLAVSAEAQRSSKGSSVSSWGQCSGSGYAGPTACIKGTFCQFGNPWYSQCLPGSADEPFVGTPDSPLGGDGNIIQTVSRVTVITVGPQNRPTTITTMITFLTPAPRPTSVVYQPPPQQGGPPPVTVIAGTTYTLVQDAPWNGNKRTVVAGQEDGPLAMPTPELTAAAFVS